MTLNRSHRELLWASKPYVRVMVFVDGGYLRKLFHDLFGDDNINLKNMQLHLIRSFDNIRQNPFRANLIRIYYYDAITDEKEKEFTEQREYFDRIREQYSFVDVVLGEAVKCSDGSFRQKGVDVLLAIDAVAMAYLDYYDVGFFLLGDRDFIPLIEAVKGAGKKAFGFFYEKTVARELRWEFDYQSCLTKEIMRFWHMKKRGSEA